MRPLRGAQGRRLTQRNAPWTGEEPRDMGHLQDEHAAPWLAGCPNREGRHDPEPEARRGRRAAPVQPGDRQSTVQP